MKIEDFDFGNNLLHEKLYENIVIYDVCISFDWCKAFVYGVTN